MKNLVSALVMLLLLAGVVVAAEKKEAAGKADEGEIIFEEKFDDFSDDEETGFTMNENRPVDISIESKIVQGKKAMRVQAREGVDYSKSYNILGVSKELSYTNDNAKFSFSYYAGPGIGGLEIMTKNETVNDNYGGSIAGLIKGKWAKATLRVKTFKPKDPKSPSSPKPGDAFKHMHIFGYVASGSDVKDQWLIIDDIKLVVDK